MVNNPKAWLDFGVCLPNLIGEREGTEKVLMKEPISFFGKDK